MPGEATAKAYMNHSTNQSKGNGDFLICGNGRKEGGR